MGLQAIETAFWPTICDQHTAKPFYAMAKISGAVAELEARTSKGRHCGFFVAALKGSTCLGVVRFSGATEFLAWKSEFEPATAVQNMFSAIIRESR